MISGVWHSKGKGSQAVKEGTVKVQRQFLECMGSWEFIARGRGLNRQRTMVVGAV